MPYPPPHSRVDCRDDWVHRRLPTTHLSAMTHTGRPAATRFVMQLLTELTEALGTLAIRAAFDRGPVAPAVWGQATVQVQS